MSTATSTLTLCCFIADVIESLIYIGRERNRETSDLERERMRDARDRGAR